MDGGLHTLQQLSVILSFVCVYNTADRGVIQKIRSKLDENVQMTLTEIQNYIRELAANIEITDAEEETEEQHRRREQRTLLIEWSACLAYLESQAEEE